MADLPRRVYLTYKYRGIWSVVYQTLIFPLRLTPLDRVLEPGSRVGRARRPARGAGTDATADR